jgi:hypothetical protein
MLLFSSYFFKRRINMEVNNTRPQIIIFDAPTVGSYTVHLPNTDRPMTVSGQHFATVLRELSSLFPEYHFVYEKDPSLIYDAKADRLLNFRDASKHALINNGIALLEAACYEARRELTLAEDEKRTPQYTDLTAKIISAFMTADKYFWILEGARRDKPKTDFNKPTVRPPVWPKGSSDYDGDDSKITDKNIWGNQKLKGVTSYKLPFGVGYSFDGDINDIDKLTKELEAIFKGFRR